MRRLYRLVLVALSMLTFTANAQVNEGFISNLEYYGRAGFDFANVIEKGEGAVGSSIGGPFGGFAVESPISGQLRINVSALGAMRGTNYHDPLIRQRFIYLDFPVKLQYGLLKNLDIYGGPQVSVLMDYSNNRVGQQESVSSVVVKDASRLDIAATAGINVPLGDNFKLGLGYFKSIKSFEGNFYHSAVRISLAVRLSSDLFNPNEYEAVASEGEQDTTVITGKESIAAYHIKNLKENALFVRLVSERNKLEMLKKKGHEERAAKVAKEQAKENSKIMKAFQDTFEFCEVYFFYDFDSRKVKNGSFKGVFLNSKQKLDSSIVPQVQDFYVADMQSIYFEEYGSNVDGISILDQDLKQLESPFPYYVRSFKSLDFLGVNRGAASLVGRLNTKLTYFYNEHY